MIYYKSISTQETLEALSRFNFRGDYMKQYKEPNELLELLISKGLIVSNKEDALNKIKKYSYYSIINSYKDVFKESNNNYKKNASFDEIYALYEFDKNIRMIFLKYILEVETIIKSLLAEVISSKYGVNKYLSIDSFDDTINKTTIQGFINKTKATIAKQNGKHEAITHYINKYGFIPPFVLTKILTFGDLSRLYAMLKQSDRQKISKNFKVSDKLLKQILKNMTLVRNICAHNDRLFSFHSKFLITFKIIDKKYKNKDNSTNIYMVMKSIQLLLDEYNKQEFENLIKAEIKKLKEKLTSIDINIVLYLMGFYE